MSNVKGGINFIYKWGINFIYI